MQAGDIDAVYMVETSTFQSPWRREDFAYEMNTNPVARYLVAELDGRIIGYAGAHLILDEGHITNVAVLEEVRGKGVGRALLAQLMQYASNLGVAYLTLEVRASNQAAISLYQSFGFIKVGIRKNYYMPEHEDAFIMVADQLPAPDPDFSEEETLFIP